MDLNAVVRSYDDQLILKPKQEESLRHIADFPSHKRDLIVNLPVGYGKSLIYHLMPAILASSGWTDPVVLVVSPLNIIQNDQLATLHAHGISACRLSIDGNADDHDHKTPSVSSSSKNSTIQNVIDGKFSIVLAHPEALLNTQTGKDLLANECFRDRVAGIVVDECHIAEEWGKEFRTAFSKLHVLPCTFPHVQIVALSGSLTVPQLKELPTTLGLRSPIVVQESPDRPNIFLSTSHKIHGKDTEQMQDKDVINVTTAELKKDQPRIRLVLCTSVAGMGFDPSCVSRVIHACPPRSMSKYLQEIGRSGRRGQSSSAILYFNKSDLRCNLPGIHQDIIDYCNSSDCLREKLLAVFGFGKNHVMRDCECCSNCMQKCDCDSCLVKAVDAILLTNHVSEQ